jgi:ankyrin repeat protein
MDFKLFISATSQLVSIPISIFSLTLASCKLFYSQRLGSLSEPDPSFKMIVIISPLIIIQLAGILFSYIAISAIYKFDIAAVVIAITIMAHCICLSIIYLKKTDTDNIKCMYNNKDEEYVTKEINSLFWMSIFTAWVSPCSVWVNNLATKSRFLLFSSAITILIKLASIYILFLRPIHLGNTKPKDRISDETRFIIIICCALPLLSLITSFFLQFSGNYFTLYKITHACFNFSCPKIFSNCLNDILNSYNKLEGYKQGKFLNWIKNAVMKNPEYATLVLPNLEYFKEFAKNQQDFIRLEYKVSNINLKRNERNTETPTKIVWSPMHDAVKEYKFGWWCFYKLLGGDAAALNGHEKSSIQIISEDMQRDSKLLDNCKPSVRWLIVMCLKNSGIDVLGNAVKLGDTMLMQNLIESGYDAFEINCIGNTLLHIAVENGHSQCAGLLINNYRLDLNAKNKCKFTALHLAAKSGNLECLNLLVENEANLNAKNIHGKTALHFAVEKAHFPCLELLINKSASLIEKDISGKTVLHYAAIIGNTECLQYLLKNTDNLEEKDFSGKTALHFAVGKTDTECLQLLLESKANVNSQDYNGKTPFHYSAGNDFLEDLTFLVSKSAKLDLKDNFGKTALHYAAENNALLVLQHLIDSNANLEEKDDKGRTAVHFAVENGHTECLKYLIEKGADLKVADKNGITPIQKAGLNRSLSCWELLYQKIESSDTGANAETEDI